MSVSTNAEMRLRGRAPSDAPGRAIERLLGIRIRGRRKRMRAVAAGHVATSVGVGAARGALDVAGTPVGAAGAATLALALVPELVIVPATGAAAPPWRWSPAEGAISVLHHAVCTPGPSSPRTRRSRPRPPSAEVRVRVGRRRSVALTGRRVLITGGSSGIGLACARRLLARTQANGATAWRPPAPTRPRLHVAAQRVGHLSAVDALGRRLGRAIRSALPPGEVRDALSGRALGHALHPLLTDVPTGLWTSATVLDAVGGPDGNRAARQLTAIGIAAALPTAASGLLDWADTEPADAEVRRSASSMPPRT